MIGLVLAMVLAGADAQPTIGVAVRVDHGEFESKATEDLEKLAAKFKERLTNKKVKRAHFVADPAEATIVVQFLSKEWQPTGSALTQTTVTSTGGYSLTKQQSAYGVYGVMMVGDFAEPFNLRLQPEQMFNKDGTLSGMVDKHIEDFIKRNYEKLSAPKK